MKLLKKKFGCASSPPIFQIEYRLMKLVLFDNIWIILMIHEFNQH